jgi:hypothetical protein
VFETDSDEAASPASVFHVFTFTCAVLLNTRKLNVTSSQESAVLVALYPAQPSARGGSVSMSASPFRDTEETAALSVSVAGCMTESES